MVSYREAGGHCVFNIIKASGMEAKQELLHYDRFHTSLYSSVIPKGIHQTSLNEATEVNWDSGHKLCLINTLLVFLSLL